MNVSSLRFETPENVEVRYQPAGLGTRFVAWFVDQIMVWLLVAAIMIFLLAVGVSIAEIFDESSGTNGAEGCRSVMYLAGLMTLVWGLGSFLYFGLLEALMNGQTIGKRASRIRVVKANGFRLDAASIIVRNIFRVIDHLPPMWVVPLLSERSQRAGDMAAGTLVVFDATPTLSAVRAELAGRSAADAKFRFDLAQLRRLAPSDFSTVERLVDRLESLSRAQQAELVGACSMRIAKKLGLAPPPLPDAIDFLQDLLAAEFRRQDRTLA